MQSLVTTFIWKCFIWDFSVQVSQLGFVFQANNFYLEVANKDLQKLTSAGTMQWMIENQRLAKTLKFEIQIEPMKLTIENLSFCFVIWLGFCGLSFIAFVSEIVWVILSRKVYIGKKTTIRMNFKSKNKITKSINVQRIIVKELNTYEIQKF